MKGTFKGMLLKPLVFEDRHGRRVVVPRNCQVTFTFDDKAYSDVSSKDLDEAIIVIKEDF